jgi:hypothetical protein
MQGECLSASRQMLRKLSMTPREKKDFLLEADS